MKNIGPKLGKLAVSVLFFHLTAGCREVLFSHVGQCLHRHVVFMTAIRHDALWAQTISVVNAV